MTLDEAISEFRAGVYASFRACRMSREEAARWTLRTFQTAVQGGESLGRETLEGALRAMLREVGRLDRSPDGGLAAWLAAEPETLLPAGEMMDEAIEQLDPSAREALVLHYQQMLDAEALSQRLRRSPGAVEKLLARARRSVGETIGWGDSTASGRGA